MSTYITGWIEINTVKESEQELWFKVIAIDVLVEQNYEVYGRLFGIRAKEGVIPVAASRGIPSGVNNCLAEQLKHESIAGATWATYEELAGPLMELCNATYMKGWTFVVESMSKLNQRFGTGNVRLTVGFDNYG